MKSLIEPSRLIGDSTSTISSLYDADITFLANPSLMLLAISITLVPFSNFFTDLSGKLTLIILSYQLSKIIQFNLFFGPKVPFNILLIPLYPK